MDAPAPAPRFAVLGPVRAWRGPAELSLGGPQQRALLAVLLLGRGRAMPVEALVDALWGDLPPARAVGTVRTYASRLRRVLETDRARPEVLVAAGNGYALRTAPGMVDAEVFEARAAEAVRARAAGDPARARELLVQALDLWDGAPLPGLPGPYLQARRARLAERRLSVLQARLETDLELGRHAEVVGELTVLSAEHPLREPLRGLLMLALYRCGRQAEALETYAAARRTLAGELGVDLGAGLRDLQERILRDDPSLAAPVPAHPPVSRGSGTAKATERPASLPAALADFTGRAPLIDRMTGWLTRRDGTAPVVVTLSGAAGVGKTALAVHVAHAVRAAYPDGQLAIDLLGTGGRLLPPAAALGEFLRALGVPGPSVPEGEDERAALFRTLLADRRVLLLLDDARDAAQIRPLLPGTGGCAVLVTSRARPAGPPGARRIDLDVLDPVEAIDLFTAIAGPRAAAERRAVVDVVALCGFLPLAVRIAAARLAARPGWPVSALAARLADGGRRLAELRIGGLAVETAFQRGYDRLEAGTARAFRLLAVPETEGLSPSAAAALLGTSRAEAGHVLESLVDLGLLDSPSPERYRYHDLLWLFARQNPEPPGERGERAAALRRLLRFALGAQLEVLRVVRPGAPMPVAGPGETGGPEFSSTAEAREWAHRELPGSLAVIRQAARLEADREAGGDTGGDPGGQAGDAGGALGEAADLLLALDPLLEDGQRWDEARPAARAVLDEAVRRGDRRSEARARYVLGRILTHTGRPDEARTHAERAAGLCRGTGDGALLAGALDLLARLAFHRRDLREVLGDPEGARRLRREALELFTGLGAAEAEETRRLPDGPPDPGPDGFTASP
ncbi:BTAD domain-containing putative transcriptional regulator [Actinomadura viridis]|uniref:AfsR/SARP family transcriptional regulator n=1 Tax=Actinomadura viridis TaxID=58110 RepID=UPI0036A3C9B4